jgi:hypothetical protein
MIAKIYEVDPLTCACGSQMKIVSFITEYRVVMKILRHLRKDERKRGRAPPGELASV